MRYYMHIEIDGRIFDPTGEKLPDDAAALGAAQQLAKSLSRNPICEGEACIRVRDSSGRIVATVPVQSAR